jgi:hypothetical protein
MEDLQSLMTCLDDISSKIPDGVYLEMADKLKRVHAQMNGNKPNDEDTFYYNDTESDTESDSEYEPLTEDELRLGREREVQKIKDEILECVKEMHEEYKVLKRWEKEARRTWTPIKRMTAARKSEAIQEWCEHLSLETIKKLPAFEKKIYDDYKERYQMKMNQHFDNVRSKVSEQQTKMGALETACVEREYLLGVGRGSRPFWNSATNDFCASGV